MSENTEKLQFLMCSQCNGLGYLERKKCRNCDGYGIVAHLDGYLLHWSRIINLQYLKLFLYDTNLNEILSTNVHYML